MVLRLGRDRSPQPVAHPDPLTPIFTLQLSRRLDSCSALDGAQRSVKAEMGCGTPWVTLEITAHFPTRLKFALS